MAVTGTLTASSKISSTQCFRSRQCAGSRPAARMARCPVSATVHKAEAQTSRREAMAGISAAAALLAASPALAFPGFGGQTKDEAYAEDTGMILKQVENLLALEKGDPAREQAVQDVRSTINKWVAKYRRANVQGKPSFGTTYTVLNALAGHFNSFGNNAPLPKKRLDRIVKEVSDAQKQLARGR